MMWLQCRQLWWLGLTACAASSRATAPVTPPTPQTKAQVQQPDTVLRFTRSTAQAEHAFLRSNAGALHVQLARLIPPQTPARGRPKLAHNSHRLLAAIPAGNLGVNLALRAARDAAPLRLMPATLRAARWRHGHRLQWTLRCDGACRWHSVYVQLGSMRWLRMAEGTDAEAHAAALRLRPHQSFMSQPGRWQLQRRLDDGHVLRVGIVAEGGAQLRPQGDELELSASSRTASFRFVVELDLPPLTPVPLHELVHGRVMPAQRHLLQALAFLAYREKLLAGSPRFLTYFGRDTLLSVMLLGERAHPSLWRTALRAVLLRLDAQGHVAHEESLSEYAHAKHGPRAGPRRILDRVATRLDYHMVDDDFLLLPALRRGLLDRAGKARPHAARWLTQPLGTTGERVADAIARNLAFVRRRSTRYAKSRSRQDLIALLPGLAVGDWRDSAAGLGGGRYPYSVNAAFVPAALAAAAQLCAAFKVTLRGCSARPTWTRLQRAWNEAWRHFESPTAPPHLRRSAPRSHAAPNPLFEAAIALDHRGEPVPVWHSDGGFRLFLQTLPAPQVDALVTRAMRPYPHGLMTPVGLLVARPSAHAKAALRARFGKRHYHGQVVWAWQLALWLQGLARQIEAHPRVPALRAKLQRAHKALVQALQHVAQHSDAELWSWSRDAEGRWHRQDFAGLAQDTVANPIQLWSAALLAAPSYGGDKSAQRR